MEQGYSYLDHQFLQLEITGNNFPFTPMTDYYQFPEFSTSQDMFWAKVKSKWYRLFITSIGIETFGKWMMQMIFLKTKAQGNCLDGTKTALTELIYALFSNVQSIMEQLISI